MTYPNQFPMGYPMGAYPTTQQMPNNFGMPAVVGYPQGFPQQYPMAGQMMPQQMPGNPYFPQQQMPQQGYAYPQQTGGIYPAVQQQPVNTAQGMQVGSIYTGDTLPSNLQQHLTGQPAQQSAAQPNGAAYPAWFAQLTGMQVNQLEQCLRQTLNNKLTKLLEQVATTVFAKFITTNGIDQNFVANLLTKSRRALQIIVLMKYKPTMVECVAAAVECVCYGTLVQELGGIASPAIQAHEMITGVNLREAWQNYNEMLSDPQTYNGIIGKFQQQYQVASGAVQQQQQQSQMLGQQQPSQGVAAIVVSQSSMLDPLDILAQELWDNKMDQLAEQQKAAIAQQELMMNNQNPNDKWNTGLVDTATPEQQQNTVPLVAEKLYDEYLRVRGLTYLDGVKHNPRWSTLKSGRRIQSLFEPTPLDPMDTDFFYRAEDQYLADMEVHYARIDREEQIRATNAAKVVSQTAAAAVTTNPVEQQHAAEMYADIAYNPEVTANQNQIQQQPQVKDPEMPKVEVVNGDAPAIPAVQQLQTTTLRRNEQTIVEREAPLGGVIQTTQNGRVIPSSATHDPASADPFGHVKPTMYYGAAATVDNLAPETDAQGDLLDEHEDAFNQMVHEREAMEAAEIEALNQAHGNPQSMDAILATARAQGIEVTEPELRVDYFNMEPKSRARYCRDLHIRKVPAYLKGKHKLIAVTKGSHRAVELEQVETVEYDKHETEFHSVKQYDTWSPSQNNAGELFVEHLKHAAGNVWSEETFVAKLNEKLEGAANADDADKALFGLVADRPIIEIEDLLSNTNATDEYQAEVLTELTERGVEDTGSILELAIVNYKRINTSRVIVNAENDKLFHDVITATTASQTIDALHVLKQNTSIPTREIARLLKIFDRHINNKLAATFANGWGVTDPLSDYDDLSDALTKAYPQITIADLQATLSAIYTDAVRVAFHMAGDGDTVEPSGIVGDVESITLLPFHYRDFPIAKADGVGYVSPEAFPELIKLLDVVSGQYSVSKLVMLDNVVITFIRGGEGEYFITNVDA